MSATLTLLLLAGACAVASSSPASRIPTAGTSPKTPRDGPGEPEPLDLADDIELFAVCLTAGLPMASAARAVASAASDNTAAHWQRIASLLGIGVTAERSFVDVEHHPGFDDLARLVRRSAGTGSAIAGGCHDLADALRSAAADRAVTRAERAGVLMSIPLTGCFLPAFLVLGLAPVIIDLGTDLITR